MFDQSFNVSKNMRQNLISSCIASVGFMVSRDGILYIFYSCRLQQMPIRLPFPPYEAESCQSGEESTILPFIWELGWIFHKFGACHDYRTIYHYTWGFKIS